MSADARPRPDMASVTRQRDCRLREAAAARTAEERESTAQTFAQVEAKETRRRRGGGASTVDADALERERFLREWEAQEEQHAEQQARQRQRERREARLAAEAAAEAVVSRWDEWPFQARPPSDFHVAAVHRRTERRRREEVAARSAHARAVRAALRAKFEQQRRDAEIRAIEGRREAGAAQADHEKFLARVERAKGRPLTRRQIHARNEAARRRKAARVGGEPERAWG